MTETPSPSAAYHRSVADQAAHHARSKTFSGSLLTPHVPHLQRLCSEVGADTLLDYGCGKAKPWLEPVPGTPLGLDEFLLLELVGLYDPCVPEYSGHHHLAREWDVVVLSHVLFWIPLEDLRAWVLPRIDALATKAIFVIETIGEEKKRILTDRDAHPRGLHAEDWLALLKPLERAGRTIELITEYKVDGRVYPGAWRL